MANAIVGWEPSHSGAWPGWRIAAIALFVCCGFRAANARADDTAKLRETADGVAFPAAGERKISLKLPLIRDILGGLPEEASKAKVFSIGSDRDTVKRWRNALTKDQVDYSGFDYIVPGPSGAETMLLSLSDGRVWKVGLFYPHLTAEKARSLLTPLSDAGENAKSVGDVFSVDVDGIRIRGLVSGEHEFPVVITHSITLDQAKSGRDEIENSTGSYRCFITIYIHPIDWYVKHHNLPKRIADAMLSVHLAKGMTEDEANIVVGSPGVVRTTERENEKQLTWKIKRKAVDGAVSDVEISATLIDGKVSTFVDEDIPLN